MKLNKWIVVVVVALGASLGASASAITNEVFRIKLSVQGAVELITLTNQVTKVKTNGVTIKVTTPVIEARIQKIVMDDNDWINLARGRDLGTKVPDNEVLATAASPFVGPIRILVFDTAAAVNLVTIGELTVDQKALGNKKNKQSSEVSDTLQILPTGNVLNGFTNGTLSVNIQSALETNGVFKSASATMLGWFTANVRSNHWQTTRDPVSAVTVLVRKATFKTQGKAIGTLFEPDPVPPTP